MAPRPLRSTVGTTPLWALLAPGALLMFGALLTSWAHAAPAVAPPAVTDLLAAAGDGHTAALDALADHGPPALRGPAAVARIHTLDGDAARRAALDAGFIVRWSALGPLPGGPRGIDAVTAPIADWRDARPGAGYPGARGPTAWRAIGSSTRFGLLDLHALQAEGPGIRLARAGFGLGSGGAVVARVHSGAPWRLWIDGQVVGGGAGEPTLRTAEPVLLNLGPGAHRLLLVTAGPRPALAVRFTAPDGRPLPVEPIGSDNGPHALSLGPLPGRPMAVPDPLASYAPEALPPRFAPRAGLSEATPAERRALAERAPARSDRWRRIARDSEGDEARRAWARVAALDPLDLEARRVVDPAAWPAPSRAPDGALRAPPSGFDGPLWWALSDHRVEVASGGALLEQWVQAARVMRADAALPTAPADADARACTVLRDGWVRPADCAAPPPVAPGDVWVVSWRRGRWHAVSHITPPPAPFGRWAVRIEADADAPVALDAPAGLTIERIDGRRIWSRVVDGAASDSGAAPIAVGTVLDEAGLAAALDARLPPHAPARVPDPAGFESALSGALARSAGQSDAIGAAETLLAGLAAAGYVADPILARPRGLAAGPLSDPADWPIPLVGLGARILDPRHPDGARPAALQGAPALRIGPGGLVEALILPVDPPERHRLVVTGELRVDGSGALLAVELARAGRSPLGDVAAWVARHPGAEVLDGGPTRLTARLPAPRAVFTLPGWSADDPPPGPHRVVVDLIVRGPADARLPADAALDGPAGRYLRRTSPTADGQRLERIFEWRGAPDAAEAEQARVFLDAVRALEAEPLVRPGGAR